MYKTAIAALEPEAIGNRKWHQAVGFRQTWPHFLDNYHKVFYGDWLPKTAHWYKWIETVKEKNANRCRI